MTLHRQASRRRLAAVPWGLLLVLAFFLLGSAVVLDNLGHSPDTVYDEAVYTQASVNVATENRFTWRGEPVFVHPPLYFILQAGWLLLLGKQGAPFFEAVDAGRALVGLFAGLNVALVVAMTLELAASAGVRRRLVLAGLAGVLAMLDPVLIRYGRVAMIDTVALTCGLLAVYGFWRLRHRPLGTWLLIGGLICGMTLLVKEIAVFLLLAPVAFGLLAGRGHIVGRALGALGVGLAFWLTFPVWAAALGLLPRFVEQKLLTLERLLGILQVTGWNRPTVSFAEAILLSAPQYLASYLVLLIGGIAMAWLWLRGRSERSDYLLAWLTTTYLFGAFTVLRGQLNEQFFVYLMPGAIVAAVIAADAAIAAATTHLRGLAPGTRRRHGLLVAIPLATAVIIPTLSLASWWRFHHVADDAGIRRMAAYVEQELPPCSVLNASGDVQKYVYGVGGHAVTSFGSGPRSLSHGVRYFFLNPKDSFARYGRMNPDFAGWIQTHGRLVAEFPSLTHWAVQLWHVDAGPFDPIADTQGYPGGVFVNVVQSACGGFAIVDDPSGRFNAAYADLGGKPTLGRPLSDRWLEGDQTRQAFDTLVLVSNGTRDVPVRPAALTVELAKSAPDAMRLAGLPLPTVAAPTTWPAARALLTDAVIASAYLDRDARTATADDWTRARERWGDPLGPPTLMPDGAIRQPFGQVVWERPPDGQARLALLGRVAVDAGLVPAAARVPEPVPDLGLVAEPPLANAIGPFLLALLAALGVWAAAGLILPHLVRSEPVPDELRSLAFAGRDRR